jgi:hypothetical protein
LCVDRQIYSPWRVRVPPASARIVFSGEPSPDDPGVCGIRLFEEQERLGNFYIVVWNASSSRRSAASCEAASTTRMLTSLHPMLRGEDGHLLQCGQRVAAV